MKTVTGLLQDFPWLAPLTTQMDTTGGWQWPDYLTAFAVVTLGSAFWQASLRLRQENDYFAPVPASTYNWRTDWVLLPYSSLLLLLIGLAAFIACSSVSKLTFWLGWIACWVGQLTPAGQRAGQRLLRAIQSVFPAAQTQRDTLGSCCSQANTIDFKREL